MTSNSALTIERLVEFRTGIARDNGDAVLTIRTGSGAVHYFALSQDDFIDFVHQMTRDATMLLASREQGGA